MDKKSAVGQQPDYRQVAHLNLTYLDKKRYKLKCALCTSKGACIQCCAGRCTTAAHPWCVVKNPKGFTRRIIKNDEGAMVWEVFCKSHAKSVNEPYKPRTKAKMSVAINIGDQPESQQSFDVNASDDYWPSSNGNDEDYVVPSKQKNPRKSTVNMQKIWNESSSSQVETSFLNGSFSDIPPKKIFEDDNVEPHSISNGDAPQQSVQFPILSFLEWPGQSEGEGMDLDHFWNVISSYFVEDHSLEWMNFMLEPFRAVNRQWDSADLDNAVSNAEPK